jgi:hypothetical protein
MRRLAAASLISIRSLCERFTGANGVSDGCGFYFRFFL